MARSTLPQSVASARSAAGRGSLSSARAKDGDERRLKQRLAAAREALERIRRGEAPTPEELAAAPQLDFWWVVTEGRFVVLQGVVTGHPLLQDGARIGTSPLLWLAEDRSAARTVSRFYRLGVPLEDVFSRKH